MPKMDKLIVIMLYLDLLCYFNIHLCKSTEHESESVTHRQFSNETTMSHGSYYDNATKDINEETWNLYDEYGYNYYYGYHYTDKNTIEMSFDIVDTYLNKSETKDFLYSFHNIVQQETIRKQLRYCPFISLCNFSFGLVNKDHKRSCCAPCSCNVSSCLKYQTCCPDILNSTFYFGSTSDHSDDMVGNYKRELQEDFLTCTLLHVKRSFLFSQNSAFMYANCADKANSSIVDMCTRKYTKDTASVEDMMPVTVSGKVIPYRNKYCAFCNGVSTDDIMFWLPSLSCKNIGKTEISAIVQPEKILINFIFSTDTCDLSFVPRNLDQVHFCSSAISWCNETGLWKKYDADIELGCFLYSSNIKAYSLIFRNVFCLLCNGFEARVPTEKCDDEIPGGGGSFPFSGLIKRSSPREEEKKKDDKEACNESTVLDTTTGTCLPLSCNELYSLQGGKCVEIFETVSHVIYKLYLRFVPVETLTISETHLMIEDILNNIQRDLFKNPNYFSISEIFSVCDVQLLYRANISLETVNSSYVIAGENTGNLLSIDTRFKLYVVDEHVPYKFANILNSLGNHNISYRSGKNEIIFKIIVRDDSLNLAYDIVHMLSSMRYESTFTPLHDLIRHSAIDRDGYTLIPYIRYSNVFCSETKEFNAVAIRGCTMVKLSVKGVSTKQVGNANTFAYQNLSFLQKEYSFENDTTIKVCVDAFLRFLNKAHGGASDTGYTNDIEELVSIICVTLSIVCLLITLFTFALFPTLRTFPGMNTFSLCLFLVLAQSLYLIGSFAKINSETVWCKVLGMLIHFFWLAAILWMNICTYHMFRVLTHTRARSAAKWSTFVIYHVYSFVLSCLCIVVNIGLSLYFSNSIGYGHQICYISSELMKTYTFGLPVLVVILANIAMFSAVIISVKRKASIHQTSSVERNDFLIFIKLSSLTGSAWLFGFIFYWTELPIFSYIFIVLNSSQGVFLMLSFVINKRIFNLFKTSLQKFGKPHLSRSGSRTYHVKISGSDSKPPLENCTLTRQTKYVSSSCSSQATPL